MATITKVSLTTEIYSTQASHEEMVPVVSQFQVYLITGLPVVTFQSIHLHTIIHVSHFQRHLLLNTIFTLIQNLQGDNYDSSIRLDLLTSNMRKKLFTIKNMKACAIIVFLFRTRLRSRGARLEFLYKDQIISISGTNMLSPSLANCHSVSSKDYCQIQMEISQRRTINYHYRRERLANKRCSSNAANWKLRTSTGHRLV